MLNSPQWSKVRWTWVPRTQLLLVLADFVSELANNVSTLGTGGLQNRRGDHVSNHFATELGGQIGKGRAKRAPPKGSRGKKRKRVDAAVARGAIEAVCLSVSKKLVPGPCSSRTVAQSLKAASMLVMQDSYSSAVA